MNDADVSTLFKAIRELLAPGVEEPQVIEAIETALRCPVCGRRKHLSCAGCRGRLGGIRTSTYKTKQVQTNAQAEKRQRVEISGGS